MRGSLWRPRLFSQNGEDYLLWHVFGTRKHGTYIDVGAFDGKYLSNSYSFELAGWRGICIEPNPASFELCERNRPRAVCVQAACVSSSSTGFVQLYVEPSGLLSGVNGERWQEVSERYERHGRSFSSFTQLSVPARKLTEIVEASVSRALEIDFISIDVEGTELDVLEGFEMERFRPRVIVVETNDDESTKRTDYYLQARGYQLGRRIGVNSFFARLPRDLKRLAHTSINCRLEPMTHPFGAEYSMPVYEDGRVIGDLTQSFQLLPRTDVLTRLQSLLFKLRRM